MPGGVLLIFYLQPFALEVCGYYSYIYFVKRNSHLTNWIKKSHDLF